MFLVKNFFTHAHCPEIPSVKKTPKFTVSEL